MTRFTGKRKSLPSMSHSFKINSRSSAVPSAHKILPVMLFLKPNASSEELPEIAAFQDLTKKKTLTIDRKDFQEKHGAHQEDIKLIKAFAREFNLKVEGFNLVERWIKLRGTVKALETAFGITILELKQDQETYYFYRGIISIPEALETAIECISGINTRPLIAKKILPTEIDISAPIFKGKAILPQDFAKYYNFPKDLDGSGQCIAIITFQGGFEQAHLDAYFKKIGIPKPDITFKELDGAIDNHASLDDDFENYMDMEVVGSLAPGAKIVLYFGDKSTMGVVRALKAVVHDTEVNPTIISMSWGVLESKVEAELLSEDELNMLNRVLQEAAALNITVITSSGDLGSSGGASGLNVELPASNPFVLSVGGSQLHLKNEVIDHEDVWNEKITYQGKQYDLSSGGGFSNWFEIPEYQKSAVSNSLNPQGKRGIPDVAANASSMPGMLLQVRDSEQISLGTSAAAPLWAALLARVNQHLEANGAPRVGFINPALYHDELSVSFNQVVSGSNGAYQAGPGWNACTGLGTPNGVELLKRLNQLLKK